MMSKRFLPNYFCGSLREFSKCYSLSAVFSFAILLIVPAYVNYILLYYIGGILFLTPFFTPAISKWLPREKISPNGKAVFITGCDRGFGYMLAQRLDKIGFQVFAGCLLPDGTGAASLRKDSSSLLHIVGIDVSNDLSVREAAAYVVENLKDNVLWAVVNNAGIFDGGEIHWTDTEIIQRLIDVNTLGVARVTKAFLGNLKESKGRVVTVTSIAGSYTFPGFVSYCMSKTATVSFCDGLRLEMYKWDVQVITIEPAIYRTAMANDFIRNINNKWAKTPKKVKDLYPPDYYQKYVKKIWTFVTNLWKDPKDVVAAMEDAIVSSHPDYSYQVGIFPSWYFVWFFQRLPKSVADMCFLFYLK